MKTITTIILALAALTAQAQNKTIHTRDHEIILEQDACSRGREGKSASGLSKSADANPALGCWYERDGFIWVRWYYIFGVRGPGLDVDIRQKFDPSRAK